MSVSLITRTTPTPEATLLHWLDGTEGDDHAAMDAARNLVDRAVGATLPDYRRQPIDLSAADTIVAYVLLALRDADAGEAS